MVGFGGDLLFNVSFVFSVLLYSSLVKLSHTLQGDKIYQVVQNPPLTSKQKFRFGLRLARESQAKTELLF